jgi:hypothetical protein
MPDLFGGDLGARATGALSSIEVAFKKWEARSRNLDLKRVSPINTSRSMAKVNGEAIPFPLLQESRLQF